MVEYNLKLIHITLQGGADNILMEIEKESGGLVCFIRNEDSPEAKLRSRGDFQWCFLLTFNSSFLVIYLSLPYYYNILLKP